MLPTPGSRSTTSPRETTPAPKQVSRSCAPGSTGPWLQSHHDEREAGYGPVARNSRRGRACLVPEFALHRDPCRESVKRRRAATTVKSWPLPHRRESHAHHIARLCAAHVGPHEVVEAGRLARRGGRRRAGRVWAAVGGSSGCGVVDEVDDGPYRFGGLLSHQRDRKSTRLNSSHVATSY